MIVPSFTLVILSGALYFVIPKFRDIFADYEAELPAITQFVIGIAAYLGSCTRDQVRGSYPEVL